MPSKRTRRTPLSHVDAHGRVQMVDVGAKADTLREAAAGAEIHVAPAAMRAVQAGSVKKGDPLQTARLAGIMAAKRTAELIPLCHPLALTHVDVEIRPRRWGFALRATARLVGKTGVEMEALTAVSVAALTIYDMLKAVDRGMTITNVCVLEKQGGRSGRYRRSR